MELENLRIADFYKDRSIFITGSTGFMGKILVEKLLQSCPDIHTIYLLVRPLKGRDISCRLQELTNNQVPTSFPIFLNLTIHLCKQNDTEQQRKKSKKRNPRKQERESCKASITSIDK